MYPALSVLEAVKLRIEDGASNGSLTSVASASSGTSKQQLETLWVGSVGGMEADLVKRAGIPFEAIPAAGVHGVGLRALPGNLWQLSRGYQAAHHILQRFQPDVLFFTGGYVAVPMAAAARTLPGRKTPSALYVPDIEPGLALKTLARFAARIAVTVDASQAYFSNRKQVVVTGYPTRPGLPAWTREAALEKLNLAPDLPTLLVFGGSKGARSINRALLAGLDDLLGEMQVVHISGQLDWAEVEAARAGLQPEQAACYRAYPYLHEMGAALRVADLVVSRAGASSLGEFPLFGLPAILVPYPYAWRYQKVNADYLANRGAAVVLKDADLTDQLLNTVRSLMHDKGRLEAMHQAMLRLAQPHAADAIAGLLLDLASP